MSFHIKIINKQIIDALSIAFPDMSTNYVNHLEDMSLHIVTKKESRKDEGFVFWQKRLAFLLDTISETKEENRKKMSEYYYDKSIHGYNQTSMIPILFAQNFMERCKEFELLHSIIVAKGLKVCIESFDGNADIYKYIVVLDVSNLLANDEEISETAHRQLEKDFNIVISNAMKHTEKELKKIEVNIPCLVSGIMTNRPQLYRGKNLGVPNAN